MMQHTPSGPRQNPAFNPSTYVAASRELQLTGFQRLLTHHNFRGDERVLDLACGDGGATAKHLFPLVPRGQVLGVDISEGMIATARGHTSSDRLRFYVGNMEALSSIAGLGVGPNSVDLIVSNYGMHWILGRERMQAFLGQVRDLLVPGGTLLSLFAEDRIFPGFFGPMHEVCSRPKWAAFFDNGSYKHHPLPDAETFREDLIRSGLRPVIFALQTDWIIFDSKANLARGVIGWLPQYINRLPDTLRQEFADAVVDHYASLAGSLPEYPTLKAGQIAIRDCSILVKATK